MFHWHLKWKQRFSFNGDAWWRKWQLCPLPAVTDQQVGQGGGGSQHLLPGQPRPCGDEAEPRLLQDDGGGPRRGLQGPGSQAAYGTDHPIPHPPCLIEKMKICGLVWSFKLWFPIYVLVTMSVATRHRVCVPTSLPVCLCSSVSNAPAFLPAIFTVPAFGFLLVLPDYAFSNVKVKVKVSFIVNSKICPIQIEESKLCLSLTNSSIRKKGSNKIK